MSNNSKKVNTGINVNRIISNGMKNTKVSSTIEKSNKYISAQLIDDSNNKVLSSSSSFALKILETKKLLRKLVKI